MAVMDRIGRVLKFPSAKKRMKALATVAIAGVLAAACGPTPPAGDDITTAQEVMFSCDNDESLSVRFLPDQEIATLIRGMDAIDLPRQPSASGFMYSDGATTIRGKGDELTVETEGSDPLQCAAQ